MVVAMAQDIGAEASVEVDVASAFDVPHVGSAGMMEDDRRVHCPVGGDDASGDVPRVGAQDRFGLGIV